MTDLKQFDLKDNVLLTGRRRRVGERGRGGGGRGGGRGGEVEGGGRGGGRGCRGGGG